MTDVSITVRPLHADEFDSWAALFRAYRIFYKLAPDEGVVERVWGWLRDPAHESNALGAMGSDGAMVGLPLPALRSTVYRLRRIYLDDLMTDRDHRRAGVGRALIDAISEIGRLDGCSIIRWITAADNLPAQRLYDSIATKTSWLTYDKPCQ